MDDLVIKLENFNISGYVDLLHILLNSRKNVRIRDVPSQKKKEEDYFVLRHDVDFDPTGVIPLAAAEYEIGVQSTYCFQVTCPYYNMASEEYLAIPKILLDYGHDIGIHYSPTLLYKYDGTDKTAQVVMRRHIGVLEALIGQEIRVISMHEPGGSPRDPMKFTKDFINAYELKEIDPQIEYVSDSAMAWRDDAYNMFISRSFPKRLQLLTHPEFWGSTMSHRNEKLKVFSSNWHEKIGRALLREQELWSKHTGVLQHNLRNGII